MCYTYWLTTTMVLDEIYLNLMFIWIESNCSLLNAFMDIICENLINLIFHIECEYFLFGIIR